MPYIKKMELKGFKSFGPQVVKIVLDKGFTAVTGPNGSGKTNVIDAFLIFVRRVKHAKTPRRNSCQTHFSRFRTSWLRKSKNGQSHHSI